MNQHNERAELIQKALETMRKTRHSIAFHAHLATKEKHALSAPILDAEIDLRLCAAMLEAQPMRPLTDDLGERALRGKYGAFLNPFIAFMDAELHANAGKGDRAGWLGMSRETALLEIYYHLAKLQKAVKRDEIGFIVEHSADVANMSMMLLDICGGLPVAGEEAAHGIKEQP